MTDLSKIAADPITGRLKYRNVTEYRLIQRYLFENRDSVLKEMISAALSRMYFREFVYHSLIFEPICCFLYIEQDSSVLDVIIPTICRTYNNQYVYTPLHTLRLTPDQEYKGYYGESIQHLHNEFTLYRPVVTSKYNKLRILDAVKRYHPINILKEVPLMQLSSLSRIKMHCMEDGISGLVNIALSTVNNINLDIYLMGNLEADIAYIGDRIEKVVPIYNNYITIGASRYYPIELK